MQKKFLSILIASVITFTSCGTQTTEQTTPITPPTTVTQQTVPQDNAETEQQADPQKANLNIGTVTWEMDREMKEEGGILYTTTVENPSTNVKLMVYLVVPTTGTSPFQTTFLVPGGTGSGLSILTSGSNLKNLLKKGFAVATFDADGRGQSQGEENLDGYDHQDGLIVASLAVAQNEAVDTNEYGIISFSYGTAMASGILARYKEEQPFQWYIDWEGPSARLSVTSGCGEEDLSNDKTGKESDNNTSKARDVSCDDDAFWSEREAVNFLPYIEIPYLRVQGEHDHVQSSNEHAIDAINAATNGVAPWTRINDEDANQTFTYGNPPKYLMNSMAKISEYAVEMMNLF